MIEKGANNWTRGLEYAYNLSSALNKELQIILFKPLEENERNNVFFKNGIQGFERFLSKFTTLVYFFEKVL